MSLHAGGCDRFLTLQYASSEMNKQAEITADPLLQAHVCHKAPASMY